ncbi:MAG TPA: hypothetical protein VF915_16975, partial [Reyranella sp.]
MTGAAILAPSLLALGAAFCFAPALILTQYGLRTVASWRSPIYTIGSSMIVAWLGALLFVDWRGFDWRAALIFAGAGCVFPVVVSILSVRFIAVGMANGTATLLLYAALGLARHRGGAPGRRLSADCHGAELFPAARREAARDRLAGNRRQRRRRRHAAGGNLM